MAKKRGNNEGSIYKRSNGRWRAQISLNGERLSFTKSEALEWLREVTKQIDYELTFYGASITFGEYLQEWLLSAKLRLTDETWRTYGQLVRDYIDPELGDIKLRELSAGQIQRYYARKVGQGVGIRTVQKTYTVMHAALNAAMKEGLIGRNPAGATNPPKPQPRGMQILSNDQIHKLLEAAESDATELYALYYVALVTGMREGEILALRWADVDLNKGNLNVRYNLKRMPGGGLQLKKPKTEASVRAIKLGTDSVNVLVQHQEQIERIKERAGRLWKDTDHVFISSVGTPIDPSNLLREFRKLLKTARLPKIRFHDLRHTAASLMLNNGVDILVASQRLGHARPSITLDVYGHVMSTIQGEAAQVMDGLVSSKK